MSEFDTERIAKRLGLTDAVICQLQALGSWVQELVKRAKMAFLPAHAGKQPETSWGLRMTRSSSST